MSQITMPCRSSRFGPRNRFQPNADVHETMNQVAETLRSRPNRRSSAFPDQSHELASRSLALTSRADERITRVLLIDHDPRLISKELRQAFAAPLHQVHVVVSGDEGLEDVRSQPPDVIVLALGSPHQSGLDVYRQIRGINSRIPVIFVTDTRRADVAIEVMKLGAYECLFQPLDLQRLQRAVGNALEAATHMREPDAWDEVAGGAEMENAIVGCCPAMQEVYKAIGRVADQSVPILITGESGTGKELVARAVYQHSPRAGGPFLALNCAAIPEHLLESELFGHEKGAFTGADRRRTGKFEQCHGGTIFLDEIGDMPLALQAKLLRVLHEQAFERVGGNETIRTDVRIIAATHRDLNAWSAEGKFRPDLYYRLSVFNIQLPPLRERGEDLELLAQHYVRQFSGELGRQVRQIAPQALERLRDYSWPGNIRELQSVLKQALLHGTGSVLLPAFLPELPGVPGRAADASPTDADSSTDAFVVRGRLASDVRELYVDAHRQLDRLLLPRVLEYTEGNKHEAALLLGIARQTLRQKVREIGLSIS
jgi:two-component system nitrogen regulation response regulator GlnG